MDGDVLRPYLHGHGRRTHLPILIYQASFGSYQVGYAAAISMVLGVLMFVCIIFYVFKSGVLED